VARFRPHREAWPEVRKARSFPMFVVSGVLIGNQTSERSEGSQPGYPGNLTCTGGRAGVEARAVVAPKRPGRCPGLTGPRAGIPCRWSTDPGRDRSGIGIAPPARQWPPRYDALRGLSGKGRRLALPPACRLPKRNPASRRVMPPAGIEPAHAVSPCAEVRKSSASVSVNGLPMARVSDLDNRWHTRCGPRKLRDGSRSHQVMPR
jgi:hypothetical protein